RRGMFPTILWIWEPPENRLAVLGELALLGHRQGVSPLAASARQYVSATSARHAGKETEFSDALNALWLICSLRGRVVASRKSMTSRHKGQPFSGDAPARQHIGAD